MQGQGKVAAVNFGFNFLSTLIPLLVHAIEHQPISGAEKNAAVTAVAESALETGLGAAAANNPGYAQMYGGLTQQLITGAVQDYNANGWQAPQVSVVIPPLVGQGHGDPLPPPIVLQPPVPASGDQTLPGHEAAQTVQVPAPSGTTGEAAAKPEDGAQYGR